MGTAVLVSEDIEAGRNVVAALDAAGFPVEAAFWLYNSDQDRWRLWIASPRAGEDLGKAYLKVREILDTVTDRTVEAVRSLISVKGLSDVRMRHNLGDHGVYIEDTLIYRTAA